MDEWERWFRGEDSELLCAHKSPVDCVKMQILICRSAATRAPYFEAAPRCCVLWTVLSLPSVSRQHHMMQLICVPFLFQLCWKNCIQLMTSCRGNFKLYPQTVRRKAFPNLRKNTINLMRTPQKQIFSSITGIRWLSSDARFFLFSLDAKLPCSVAQNGIPQNWEMGY